MGCEGWGRRRGRGRCMCVIGGGGLQTHTPALPTPVLTTHPPSHPPTQPPTHLLVPLKVVYERSRVGVPHAHAAVVGARRQHDAPRPALPPPHHGHAALVPCARTTRGGGGGGGRVWVWMRACMHKGGGQGTHAAALSRRGVGVDACVHAQGRGAGDPCSRTQQEGGTGASHTAHSLFSPSPSPLPLHLPHL